MTNILFVCVHNAGRSQMAEALFNRLAAERGVAACSTSAGTAPVDRINPIVVDVMSEIGYDLTDRVPRQLTPTMAASADRIITMGCGVDTSSCPAGALVTEDWQLSDPREEPIESVRKIRDAIQFRVDALLRELDPKP